MAERQTQTYRIFQCPRCKNLEVHYSKERVGFCTEFQQDVVQRGDPFMERVDQCKHWEKGRPKYEK